MLVNYKIYCQMYMNERTVQYSSHYTCNIMNTVNQTTLDSEMNQVHDKRTNTTPLKDTDMRLITDLHSRDRPE